MAVEKEIEIKQKSRLRENIEAILVAVLLALFIRTFIVQAFKIPSGSMKQTLQVGDHILVNKFVYGIKLPYMQKVIIPVKKPRRGDIIVFKFPVEPEKDFIKRVVGVPGDIVEARDKKIYLNNQPLVEAYAINTDPRILPKGIQEFKRDNFDPITVPENALFVMGDNRDHSHDSRFWGFVDMKKVRGKAFMIYWSWDKNNYDKKPIYRRVRWDRIGQILK